MPEIPHGNIMMDWVATCGQGFDYPPSEFYGVERTDGSAVSLQFNRRWVRKREIAYFGVTEEEWDREYAVWKRANPDLRYWVTGGRLMVRALPTRRETELGRFIGKRSDNGFWLLNGDGFENRTLQRRQAELRNMTEMAFPTPRARRRNVSRRIVVPYQALNSARLDLDSIRIIHVTRDGNVSTPREVPKPPERLLKENMPTCEHKQVNVAGTGDPPSYRDRRDNERTFTYDGRQYRAQRWNLADPVRLQVMHHAEFSANPQWHEIRIQDGKWMVNENVHRLGASVFSAVGPDGQRHRWVSAFDQNENPAMYFLAQLPDKGYTRYYGHALKLLAPPIVHKAREQGKRVFRQGDIFAVETDLTDEKFEGLITCRDEIFDSSVLTDAGTPQLAPRGVTPTDQRVTGLSEEGRKDWRKRRKLMIYGTGHTATWVAVKPDGATFVKGVMFHDPILENVNARNPRQPEHTPVTLLPDKWFLCVRNQVPRQPVITTTDTQPSRGVNT